MVIGPDGDRSGKKSTKRVAIYCASDDLLCDRKDDGRPIRRRGVTAVTNPYGFSTRPRGQSVCLRSVYGDRQDPSASIKTLSDVPGGCRWRANRCFNVCGRYASILHFAFQVLITVRVHCIEQDCGNRFRVFEPWSP